MRSALLVLLALGLVVLAAPTALADTYHHFNCTAQGWVPCVEGCVDHVARHVASGDFNLGLPPCLLHP